MRKSLLTLGVLVFSFQPVWRFVGWLSDVEFLVRHWAQIVDFLGSGWGVVLTTTVGVALLILALRRPSDAPRRVPTEPPVTPPTPVPLREAMGQRYERQTVPFDGNRYVNCTFHDCTIIYNGGPMQLHNCVVEADVKLVTNHPLIKNYLKILEILSGDSLREGKSVQISTVSFTLPS